MGSLCDEIDVFEIENKQYGGILKISEVGFQDYNDKPKHLLRLESDGLFLNKVCAKKLINFLLQELKIDKDKLKQNKEMIEG